MVNGEGNVQYCFFGNPQCPICDALTGTLSSEPIPAPHENCQCTSEPVDEDCQHTYAYVGSSTRYGPNGDCFVFDAEVTVTCSDGTEIGASIPIDFGCTGAEYKDDFWDNLEDALSDTVSELTEGCKCEQKNVA